MIEYKKYEKNGDIHWQWYNTPGHNYKKLVDDALRPFAKVKTGSVIDIGAGDGLPLSILYEWGFKCYGVEPVVLGVELALKHALRAEFFVEMAEKFAKREMTFDYLLSINTIEHLDDPSCMVEIMKRINKFGVIMTDNAETIHKTSEFHTKVFKPSEFEELFKDFELERLPVEHEGYMAYKITKRSL